MKYGDQTTLKITGVDKKGRGCGKIGEREAGAYFALPGEEIAAHMTARRQGIISLEVDEVVTPSPHRVKPRCPHAGACGGCKWQMFDYEMQLELKRGLVNDALEGAGLDRPIATVVPSPELYGFRNRMDFCVGWRGEVGLKRPGHWNAYIDLKECHLLSPDATKALKEFRDWMKNNKIEPWDGKKYTGYARYIVIREGKNTGERLITIVTSSGALPAEDDLVTRMKPLATTLYHGINPTVADLSIASEMRLLYGPPNLTEEIDGRRFQIPPNSFFQTNTLMAGELVKIAREFLGKKNGTLLDLYCGVGFLGISLADTTKKIIGVELDAAAIEIARENAKINGLKNAEFTAAAAESLIWENEQPDTVIVDPPRAGLHPKVVMTLLARRPKRILYVSCNYESFAREWKALGTAYDITRQAALDLFPHGPHVELISLLEAKR